MTRIYLVFDCETSGLLDYKKDLMHESQPRIVQLAAILCSETGEVLEIMNKAVKPHNWVVDDETAKIHGWTTEKLNECGTPMPEVLAEFNGMKARCTDRVAFNASYDKRMLLREERLYNID